MFREAGKVSSYIFFCDKLVINIPGCFVVLLTLTSVLPALLNMSAVFGLQHWPFLKKRVTFMLCSVRDQFMKSVGFKGNEKCNMLLAKMFKQLHFSSGRYAQLCVLMIQDEQLPNQSDTPVLEKKLNL